MNNNLQTATLAGGCFWCLEAVFDEVKGVHGVESGYAGGQVENPTYRAVCNGNTGHAEVVQVHFDPGIVSYRDLLNVFFAIHDPTTLNRQGGDVGTQYRSAIYTSTEAQYAAAEASKRAYQDALTKAHRATITTEIREAPEFYYAEEYHQQYLAKNPNGYCGLGGCGVSYSPAVAVSAN